MKVLMITHPTGEQIPIIVGTDGMPLTLPNEYLLSRRTKSSNTLLRNARELIVLYEWFEENNIDFKSKLLAQVSFTSAQINSALFEHLRKSKGSSQVVSPATFNQRMMTVRGFFMWYLNGLISQLPYSSKMYQNLNKRKLLFDDWFSSSFISSVPSKKHLRKGLSLNEVQFLMNVLDPNVESSFGLNQAVKYRNYISVGLMLFCGLRPGELLSLRVEDISIGAISSVEIIRRAPDLNDTRSPRPQIKRNGRVLPIENRKLIKYLNDYIVYWRDVLEESSEVESDYLVLSDEGKPLSQGSITQLFHLLRDKYKNDLPLNLSAKSLRHTFSSQMEKVMRSNGISEERRREALMILRGDSQRSSQDVYIAQEVEEQSRAALNAYQSKLIK